jgi:putative ABC transport system permease protein
VLRLALRTSRTRKAGFAGALLAIALAVAVITAGGFLLQSALAGDGGSRRFHAVTLVVTGERPAAAGDPADLPPPPVPVEVARRIAQVDGVRDVVGDVAFYSSIAGAGPTRGHGWSSAALTPYRLREGRAPVEPDEIVLDRAAAARTGLALGDQVEVVTAVDGTRRYQVSGIAEQGVAGPLRAAASVFFTDRTAGRLSGRPAHAGAVAVFAEPGVDAARLASRVREAAGTGTVVLGDASLAEPSDASGGYGATAAFLGIMSAVAGFVAIFVVAGTFALLIVQRHREMALLRAVGATGRQIRRMIAVEALVTSVIALGVGVAAGFALSRPLAGLLVSLGVAPAGFQPVHGPVPVIVAAVAGIGLTQLAALAAGNRAARVRPVEALRESAVPARRLSRPRLLAGAAFLALSVFVVVNSIATGGSKGSADAFVVAFTLMITVTLLGPVLVIPVIRLVAPLVALLGGGPGVLAAANARADPRRTAAASTPITLAVTFTCVMIFMPQTTQMLTLQESRLRVRADHILVSADGQGLPSAVARDAADLPGVTAVAATTPVPVRLGTAAIGGPVPARTLMAFAVSPVQVPSLLDLGVRDGDLGALSGDTIAASSDAAGEHGWRLGDRIPATLPDGRLADLRLVAVYDRSLGLSDLLVPAAFAAPQGLAAAVYVKGGEAGLGALTARHPTLVALSPEAYFARMEQGGEAQTTAVYVFIMLIGLYTAISVVNTLFAVTAARVREFAALRLAGSTRRQVLRMAGGEAAITVAVAVIVGTLVAATTLVSSSLALARTTAFAAPPLVYLSIVALAAVLGLAATLLAARLAVRRSPVSIVSARE